MRAAFIEQTGPPDSIQVGDLPDPKPGAGQVLVRVRAASINPIDLYVRAGIVAMPMAFPFVIGADFAGTVEALGSGTTRFQVGDRVWGSNQGLVGRPGITAELAAIDEDFVYPTPDGQTDLEAAAQALVGITAHIGLVQKAQVKPGETVYVPGGSGGVGSMVVQMAKAIGARVATSAGSDDRVEYCKSLGADLVLNYKTDPIPEKLREFAQEGYDVWFETQREPNFEVSVPLLKRKGRMIVMAGRTAKPALPIGMFYPRDCTLFGFAMFNATPTDQRIAADDIIGWVQTGKLKPRIGKTFSLEQASQAHAFLEANTLHGAGQSMGKVVIEIG